MPSMEEIRWVPHPKMIVDGLTNKGSSMKALYDLLDTGEYQIVDEDVSLAEKKQEREQRGYSRR